MQLVQTPGQDQRPILTWLLIYEDLTCNFHQQTLTGVYVYSVHKHVSGGSRNLWLCDSVKMIHVDCDYKNKPRTYSLTNIELIRKAWYSTRPKTE